MWVQCDACDKWRTLPAGCAEPAGEWVCAMHPLRSLASCDVDEEAHGASDDGAWACGVAEQKQRAAAALELARVEGLGLARSRGRGYKHALRHPSVDGKPWRACIALDAHGLVAPASRAVDGAPLRWLDVHATAEEAALEASRFVQHYTPHFEALVAALAADAAHPHPHLHPDALVADASHTRSPEPMPPSAALHAELEPGATSRQSLAGQVQSARRSLAGETLLFYWPIDDAWYAARCVEHLGGATLTLTLTLTRTQVRGEVRRASGRRHVSLRVARRAARGGAATGLTRA